MTLDARVAVRLGSLALEAALTAEAGELVAIVGPNGAGKTTLLRALAGLVPLHAGRIVLDGTVIADVEAAVDVPPERRGTSLMFADGLLFPHMSARDNVAFGLRAGGLGRRESRARAETLLGDVGLGGRGATRPGRLSGGERQRVALARALITEPRLLLLDEPFAAVDVASRVELRRLLRAQLARRSGVRVMVTHDPIEAMALAARVVVLEQGRVVQSGSIAEVTARPRSAWVATMLGLNLFPGVAVDGGIELGTTTIAAVGTVRGPAFAVVHPRAIALHRTQPEGSPRNVWRGQVESLDPRTDTVRVRVTGAVPVVAEVTPAAVTDLQLSAGSEVWVTVKATEVQVFAA